MKFTKMHGLGNDYLYVYGEVPPDVSELSVRLSERHFGAGSDGMIFISPSDRADFAMRIFNADGSEAKMCGNGIRCVGKYVYDRHYTDKTRLTVDTLSGIKTLELEVNDGAVSSVTVDMGAVCVSDRMYVGDTELTPVSVGNPHAVIFVPDADSAPVDTLGPKIEHSDAFEGGVNVEFVSVEGKNTLRMRVWERGSGITMACGTGACASTAAAVARGLCERNAPVSVRLDGGTLQITVADDNSIRMTGPAEFVYEGETLC